MQRGGPGAPAQGNQQATLVPLDYFDGERFELEQRYVRGCAWYFAGLTYDLEEHGQYLTVQVGGRSVVVQKFRDELCAFTNVCTHRGSRLRSCRSGSGPLRCPYHGWTFDSRGLPVGIPHRQSFSGLDKIGLEALALERWQVGLCGRFVFVSVPEVTTSLSEYLGTYWNELEIISAALGERVDVNELIITANWKVAVENTLESYHVDLIHPATFRKLGAGGMEFDFEGPHSSWTAELSDDAVSAWKRVENRFASRPIRTQKYKHLFVFPSLTVASSFGATFAIQSFEALSPEMTRFVSNVFVTKAERSGALRGLGLSATEFNRKVFEEDRVICEQVQLGLRDARGLGPLSAMEARVAAFQRACTTRGEPEEARSDRGVGAKRGHQ